MVSACAVLVPIDQIVRRRTSSQVDTRRGQELRRKSMSGVELLPFRKAGAISRFISSERSGRKGR